MKKELRILILEDIPTDAQLIEHGLRKAGIAFCSRVVMTREDFITEIEEFAPDLILSDNNLPHFSGIEALEIVRQKCPDVPFIMVSGSIGEERAVDILRRGATDYVLKDRLFRLVPVINRALQEAEEHIGRKQAEDALRQKEAEYRGIFEATTDALFILDLRGNIKEVNPQACKMYGYPYGELITLSVRELLFPEHEYLFEQFITEVKTKKSFQGESVNVRKDRTSFNVDVRAAEFHYRGEEHLLGIARDITERKRMEKTIRQSEKRLQDILDNAPVVIYFKDTQGRHLLINRRYEILFHITKERMAGKTDYDIFPREKADILWANDQKVIRAQTPMEFEEVVTQDDMTHTYISIKFPLFDSAGVVSGVCGMSTDITERKKAEERIKVQLDRLAALRAIDMAITASLDLRVTFNVFLDQATAHLGVDAADVLLLDPHTYRLEYAASRGFRTAALKYTSLTLGEGYAGLAALERRIVSISNVEEATDGLKRAPLLGKEDFVTYYGVPLIAKGQIKGVLEIFHRAPLQPDQEWLDFLEALAGQAAIAIDNATLFNDLQRSNVELVNAYDTTLEGWSRALDLRDKETEGHSERVTEMTVRLARAIGLSNSDLVHVRRGALLHDIGKMGVPDKILLKPGPLTKGEWEIMRQHPVYAYELLSPIAFLRPAVDIPYCHHEKWDGTGYPRGLKGEQIPVPAQIFAIADVWDALRSDRPYRPAWPDEKARECIREQAGTHFKPTIVEMFLKLLDD